MSLEIGRFLTHMAQFSSGTTIITVSVQLPPTNPKNRVKIKMPKLSIFDE